MSASTITAGRAIAAPSFAVPLANLAIGVSFLLLYGGGLLTMAQTWWVDPEAQHGLLLGPLSIWLAYKAGLHPDRRPQPILGLSVLTASVALRWLSGLMVERYTLGLAVVGAGIGLIICFWGARQVARWWLPAALLVLSIPLPSLVLNSLALPLQFMASKIGAALLEWRGVPTLLAGNVLRLPGRTLFVTEACSGLRSLTALLSLSLLIGGLSLRMPVTRLTLMASGIVIAVLLNGVRVFLTGFLVYFVSPAFGDGFLHYTEGWLIFVLAFLLIGAVAWLLASAEGLLARRTAR